MPRILVLIAVLLSGCGVSAGGFVAGTTGYLREYNRGRSSEVITDSERAEMTAWLSRNYGGK